MRVAFSTISPAGSPFSRQITDLFATEELHVQTGSASGILRRINDSQVEVTGKLTAALVLPCDRCLVDCIYMVESDLYLLLVADSMPDSMQEMREGWERIVLEEPYIHLDEVLREQIWLTVPVKHLCLEQCKGLCAQCGENLNLHACCCAPISGNPAFAVLKQLKQNKT